MALRETETAPRGSRTKQVTFWLTPDEKTELHALAQELGMDVSKTIRYGLRLAEAAAVKR